MTAHSATSRGILLVLVSWAPDAPAGIERATAALAVGLARSGHRPVIATAVPQPATPILTGVAVEQLQLDDVTFPCDDATLRRAVSRQDGRLSAQIRALVERHRIDTVLFTDALWGLGRLRGDFPRGVRRALAVHVPPHIADAGPALARAERVIMPSSVVSQQLTATWPRDWWRVVPNALMSDPHDRPLPDARHRETLRRSGPVRVLARLGPEKGVAELLEAVQGWDRQVEAALAHAGFEDATGSQATLLRNCQELAAQSDNIHLRPSLTWNKVPAWLAGAAAVIVPSHKETFGLVALEAMSVGTPVVAYRVGNLPALIEPAGHGERLLVDHDAGPEALRKATEMLLEDDILYAATTQTVYRRAGAFAPDRIAQLFLEAVA